MQLKIIQSCPRFLHDLKVKSSKVHRGHIGASVCAIHIGHAPPFASDKTRSLNNLLWPCLKAIGCENVGHATLACI